MRDCITAFLVVHALFYLSFIAKKEDGDSKELQETLDSCQQLPNLSHVSDERKNDEKNC